MCETNQREDLEVVSSKPIADQLLALLDGCVQALGLDDLSRQEETRGQVALYADEAGRVAQIGNDHCLQNVFTLPFCFFILMRLYHSNDPVVEARNSQDCPRAKLFKAFDVGGIEKSFSDDVVLLGVAGICSSGGCSVERLDRPVSHANWLSHDRQHQGSVFREVARCVMGLLDKIIVSGRHSRATNVVRPAER